MKQFFLITMLLLLTACVPTGGQDLLSDSVSNRATADAAIQLAQYQEQFLTASAQAPIIDITSTAAAFEMQQIYSQATSQAAAQTQAAGITMTAQSWTPTPNATGTVVALDLQRREINNQFWAIAPGIVLVFALLCGAVALMLIVRRERLKPAITDANGRIMPIIDTVHGTIVDIEGMPNYRGETHDDLLKQVITHLLIKYLDLKPSLPAITAERQDQVKARLQITDMATRAKLPKSLLQAQGLIPPDNNLLPDPDDDETLITEYPLPEWGAWMQQWKPGHLALGINEKGLLQVNPEHNPHFLFAGTTGSGKTRAGVRVLVTCALASGWQVIIAGKELDYKVFENHPNAYLLPFSMIDNPTRAIDLLKSVYHEIERRNNLMSKSGYSLWAQTGRTRTMVVVDEFSNLADALEDIHKSRREELWRWARMDTAEARKFGIHMVYALQDPTAQSIDLRIRRNTKPVMFRVQDAASSRTLLNQSGAEALPVRHFMALMVELERGSALERGAAFAPSDAEIGQFLTVHPVNKAEDNGGWIEGVVSDAPSQLTDNIRRVTDEDPPVPQQTFGSFIASLDGKATRVIELHNQGGMTDSEIAREAFGYTNGDKVRQVQSIIKRYQDLKTTTTTENMPDFEAFASSSS